MEKICAFRGFRVVPPALFLVVLVWVGASLSAAAAEPDLIIFTPANAGAAPAAEALPLLDSVSQYGITWTFDSPARVGRFVNGDYYVVGPVTVKAITPVPADGRNGSMLNIPISSTSFESKVGFDSRTPHGRYDGTLFRSAPISMSPGDALVSSISMDESYKGEKIQAMLTKPKSSHPLSYIRTAAVLTCLPAPVPADAFRPAYADRTQRIYLARNLKRDALPRLDAVDEMPEFAKWERMVERPWLDVVMDEFGAPLENMPVYGREFSRVTSIATLLLAMDVPASRKERLLVSTVQVGIDLWGLVRAGKPGWPPLGGHGNGRKWTIIFTGMMLGDEEMMHPRKTYPELVFSEDKQTMFGDCWTGAKVVYAGHVGAQGHRSKKGWGAYEHLTPDKWESKIGESYRRCCTSMSWVGTALAIRVYGAQKLWDHDAFLAYADRWMTEDDSEYVKIIKAATGWDFDNDWSRQGMVWDPYVKNLWNRYRSDLGE